MDNFKVSIATGIIAAIIISGLFHATNTVDSDKDGLTNSMEAKLGTNPHAWDSDSDGMCDSREVSGKSNPLDNKSMCCGGGPGFMSQKNCMKIANI